ncbi:hypothetical protein D3C86_1340500 [compost metagenome]
MPVLATLACVAIGLRVRQYGWTLERVWAAAAAGTLWLYAIGYAGAALHSVRQGAVRPWLQLLAPVNQVMSLLVLALLLALQTPLLDGQRISAASQGERLRADPAQATLERLVDLKWGHGPYGVAALDTLAQDPGFQTGEPRQRMDLVRAAATRPAVPTESAQSEGFDLATAQERIKTPPGMQPAQPDWWAWFFQQPQHAHWARQCLLPGADCLLLSGDWDQDQQTDHLLCPLHPRADLNCRLSARDAAAQWQDEGNVRWPGTHSAEAGAAMRDLLRNGRIDTERQRWPDWQLPHPHAGGNASPFTGRLQPGVD